MQEIHKKKKILFLASCDIFSILIIILLSLYFLQKLTIFGTATTPDSIAYLDASQNIAEGFGLNESTYLLSPQFKPFTTWPPLYPFILSFFAAPHINGPIEASRLALISFPITVMLMYLALRHFASCYLALLGTLVFLFSHPMFTVFTYAWSETLFIPLLLSSILICNFCIKVSSKDKKTLEIIGISMLTILLVALAYCRYIGVVFFALLPLSWLANTSKKNLKYYILACFVYIVFFCGLLLRNYYLTNYLSGYIRPISNTNLLGNVIYIWNAIKIQFLFVEERAWIIFLVLLVAILTKHLTSKKYSILNYRANNNQFIILCAVCILNYLIPLLILSSLKGFDFLDTRYISPIWPFIIIFLIFFLSIKWNSLMKLLYALPLFAFTIILIVCIFEKNLYTYKSVSDDWLNNPQKLRFQRSPNKGYTNSTRNITQTSNPSLEGMIYDLKMINDFDLLITDYPAVPLIQLLSGIRSREFPPSTINDGIIREINSSGKNGYIMVEKFSQKRLLDYYKNNSLKLSFNKYFKDKYGLLLVKLPLPFAD